MLHFSSVSDSDRMLEAGTIRARAITTRWNVFTSRRTQQPPPVLLALCCRARIWNLEMNFFFSAAWFKPLRWRWRIADHHYSFAIQGILICALLSGKEKKRSISDFIFERNQEAWRCLAAGGGSSRELPDLFFCTNISNCWQPRSASAAFLHHYVQYCKTKQSRHKELHIYHETSHNANLWSGIWSWGVYLINMSN